MKKSIKYSLIAIGALIVTFSLLKVIESDVQIESSKVVKADISTLKEEITDFKKFVTWSPWADDDPNQKMEFKGPQGQVGAEFSWSGNSDVGTGRQEVTAIGDNRVEMELEFTNPFTFTALVYYDLQSVDENSTKVTWGFLRKDTPLLDGFFAKASLPQKYDEGLANLQKKFE